MDTLLPPPQNYEAPRSTMNGKPVFTVPARQIINLDSGFAPKLLCDGPTFSTGSACAYSCSFCYVPDIMRKSPHLKGMPPHESIVLLRDGALQAMKDQLLLRGQPRYADPADQRVIFASPLVDVAANMDLVHETVEACKLLLKYTHWHIRLLSKSNLLPKVAKLLEWGAENNAGYTVEDVHRRLIFGVSTGTLDDKLAAAFEQGTALVSKRLASLHWLQDAGFRTFGMICPSLPQQDHDAFALSMSEAIRAEKCEHVWAEVINVRGDSMLRTIAALTSAGYNWEADKLLRYSTLKQGWEYGARRTFLAHARVYQRHHPNSLGGLKLRFLQYVTKNSAPWWNSQIRNGAVLLGKAAHG